MPKKKSNQPFCPIWSQILEEKTPCLERKCKKFMPLLSDELKKESGVEGYCSDELKVHFLEDIMTSLGILAEIQLESTSEEDREEVLEKSKKEKVFGYE